MPHEKKQQAQEDFGRHLIEQRSRMAEMVRKWIETDTKYSLPIYDQLLSRIKTLDPAFREDIASVALFMADEIVSAVLGTLDGSDDLLANGKTVNYAIVAQIREPGSDEVIDQFDINRGEPIIAIWDRYKRWLSRYAPSNLLPSSLRPSK